MGGGPPHQRLGCDTQSIENAICSPGAIFPKSLIYFRKLSAPQSRRLERPRNSRSQHSNPGGARCFSSASVAQMLAAASIKVMDALFGLVARNDAEWYR